MLADTTMWLTYTQVIAVALAAAEWVTDSETGKQYIDLRTKGKIHGGNQEACQDIGAFLPEPRNKQENDFLSRMNASDEFRLGLRLREGAWRWDTDSSEVGWTNWAQALTGTYDCAVTALNRDGHERDRWLDVGCTSIIGISTVVCEKDSNGDDETHSDDPSDDDSSFFHSDTAIAIGAVVAVVGTVSATVGILSMFTNVFQTAQPATQPDTTQASHNKDVVQDNADGINALSDLAKHDSSSSSSSSQDEGIQSHGNIKHSHADVIRSTGNTKSTIQVDTVSKSPSESSSSYS